MKAKILAADCEKLQYDRCIVPYAKIIDGQERPKESYFLTHEDEPAEGSIFAQICKKWGVTNV